MLKPPDVPRAAVQVTDVEGPEGPRFVSIPTKVTAPDESEAFRIGDM
jgi:hypothetical protein